MDLRERLIFEIRKNSHTCTICLNKVKSDDPIWTCSKCYQMFHLKCIKSWAQKSLEKDENGDTKDTWRCPTCQREESTLPDKLEYRCFCGSRKNPYFIPGVNRLPHSCDGVCRKMRPKKTPTSIDCRHPCTELCHPGPCPTCVMTINVSCPCGKELTTLRCGSEMAKPCGRICQQPLDSEKCHLGLHLCSEKCHSGDCPPCKVLLKAYCFCNSNSKFFECGSQDAVNLDVIPFDLKTDEQSGALILKSIYSCDKVCGNPLSCNKHTCSRQCHQGACGRCRLMPAFCLMCPCGKTPLRKLVSSGDINGDRKDCTDPIPCCENLCSKKLKCGHLCKENCHEGPCPECQETTAIRCRCSKSVKHMKCSDNEKGEFLCDRVCRKFMNCRRHKCKDNCCNIEDHICFEKCNRKLSCGQHNCEELCHFGQCPPCWRGVIYETIYCHCGATSLLPPQPCGTKPECDKPCARSHICFHPVKHNCHNDPTCPPCTVLMTKPCPGGHTMLPNIPCFQNVLTCGQVCNKQLPTCDHTCTQRCHPGLCIQEGSVCTQKCKKDRQECGHPCSAPCHPGTPCEDVMKPCKAPVKLKCECGVRTETMKCFKLLADEDLMTRRFRMVCIDEKAADGSVKIQPYKPKDADLQGNLPNYLKDSGNAILACNKVCLEAEEKREQEAERSKLRESLWLRDAPDNKDLNELLYPFPPPEYSPFLKKFASKNMQFAREVEEKIEEVVISARDPKGNGRAYHRFPPMNKNKRRFLVELCEFYGIEATTFDPEPNRHIMLTGLRGLAKFPGLSNGSMNKLTNIVLKEKLAALNKPAGTTKPRSTASETTPSATETTKAGEESKEEKELKQDQVFPT